jgi:hypothetical protein
VTRHRFRVEAEAYGVHLEVRVDHSGTATVEELGRALSIAAAQALTEHQQQREESR